MDTLPSIGLGTYKLKGELCRHVVKDALMLGYRAIDTAAVYKNEDMVYNGILDSGVSRDSIFVTSKLQPKDQGRVKSLEAWNKTVTLLGGVPPDAYLIHWPGAAGEKPESESNAIKRLETWRVMEGLYKEKKVRVIGVSNYTVRHLQELLEVCEVKPQINQVELHILLQQRELLEFCKSHGIHVTSYSTLGCGNLVKHPAVLETCDKYGIKPTVLLLAWALSKGVSVIPKASSVDHLRENLFDPSTIPQEAIEYLDEKCKGCEEERYCWDPTKIR